MQHLTLEALARLVDEPPDAAESGHLAACPECRTELDALRRETAALGRLGPVEPAGAEWTALEARLEREGLLAAPAGAGRGLPVRRWTPRLLRIAAALALYAVGTATGLAVRGRAAAPLAPAPVTAPPTHETASSPGAAGTAPLAAAATSLEENAAAPPEAADARLASNAAEVAAEPATPEQALRAVQAAERAYLRAYSRYTDLTSGQRQLDDPVARVAALESIVLTTRAALDRAPADPVINGYHLTAVAQRDAALRQIALKSNEPWF